MITAASFVKSEQLSESTYRIIVRLTDDAVPAYDFGFTASGNTLVELRDDISRQIAAKNGRLTVRNILSGITPGTAIPIAPPAVTPPTPTAAEVWQEKARRLAKLEAMGIVSGALATAITALRTDVVNTYVDGFLAGL